MTPLQYIRTEVFGVTQVEMAEIVGVTQSTISKWESDGASEEPSLGDMAVIRAAAAKRRLRWDDAWFFDVPKIKA